MTTARHSLRQWLIRGGHTDVDYMVRQLRKYGLYSRRPLNYDRFNEKIEAIINIWIQEAKCLSK